MLRMSIVLTSVSLLLFVCCATQIVVARTYRSVKTPLGDVTGESYRLYSLRFHPIDTFLGIPYALPPVGNLRFEVTCELKV